MATMNIQIFGTSKCFDTKKAVRYFKERNIKYQLIDIKEKEMSKGELTSVVQAVGGLDSVINWNHKDQDLIALIKHIVQEDKFEKVLENQKIFVNFVNYKVRQVNQVCYALGCSLLLPIQNFRGV